jgi:hypothetical protein
MSTPRPLLEEVLPRFDANGVHDVWVAVAPQVVFAAVRQVPAREVRLLKPLEAVCARCPACSCDGGPAAVRTREECLSFVEPGHAKAAIAFLVRPERGGSRVITETRVAGTSPDATRALLRYWRAIRPGRGAIRRSWLAAIRRRAVRFWNSNTETRTRMADSLLTVQWRDRSFVLRAPEQVEELGRRLRQKGLADIEVSIRGAVVEGKTGSEKLLSDEEREAVCAVLTDAESDPALRRAFNLLCAEPEPSEAT